MRVAVASGKGGTGKTVLSTNLAWLLAGEGERVTYVDADVEAPNGHLFLHPEWLRKAGFSVPVPSLRGATCSGCRACQEVCAFNAIVALPDRVMVFPELCHACGACLMACEERALVETSREIGTVRRGRSGAIPVWDAVLNVGEVRATPLIRGLLDSQAAAEPSNEGLVIVDAPPGTSCNAVTVVRDADVVILVTEPTPFGLHDLKLAVAMCRELGRPVHAVINRSDVGDGETRSWLEQELIPLAAEIPFSHEVASSYARGELAARTSPSFRRALTRLVGRVLERHL
jgi:MinD superfamily P-loop ATPase